MKVGDKELDHPWWVNYKNPMTPEEHEAFASKLFGTPHWVKNLEDWQKYAAHLMLRLTQYHDKFSFLQEKFVDDDNLLEIYPPLQEITRKYEHAFGELKTKHPDLL